MSEVSHRRVAPLPCRNIDAAEQRRLSFERLRRFIERDVLPYSPYYRRLFASSGFDPGKLKSESDLARIPLTTKDDFQRFGPDFVLQPRWPGKADGLDTEEISREYWDTYAAAENLDDDIEAPQSPDDRQYRAFLLDWQPILTTRTGGTTGASAYSVYTHSDLLGPFKRAARFHHNIHSWTPTQRFMSLLPAGEHLGFYGNLLVPLLNGQPLRPTFGGRVTSTENQILSAATSKIQALQGSSSYLAHWLDTACQMMRAGQIEGLASLQVIIASAEPLSEGYAQSVHTGLVILGAGDAHLVQGMSSTELKSGGFRECDTGMGLHVDPQHYFIELLDPETKQPVPEGKPGVLVWSHIDWHGSVILRYWSGDVVDGGARFGRCPNCGLVVPRLFPPLRRVQSDFLKIRGTRVDLTDLRTALEALFGRDAFQVEIRSDSKSVGRHRFTVYGQKGKVEGADLVKEVVRSAVELGVDEVVFCDATQMHERLYGAGGWKPRWLINE